MGLSRGALVDPADLTKGYIKSTEVAPGKDGQTADAETIELARDVLAALHGAGPPADQLDKARARLAADALGFAASASAEDSARLCEGLGKLFHRLEASHGDKAIATLEASIVAQTASVLFGPQGTNDMHAGTQAVEDLLASDANSLHERISNAMASALPSNDPVLLLSAALASQPGGMHRLAALMGDSSIGSVRMESLSVGLSSWQEATQADLPKDQRDLLRRAANYAAGLAGSGHAEWSGEELREGRIAYQSVRNGMVQRGEGSDYEAANKWLEKFGSKWLERTSERNIRATSTFYGGALNAASTLIPKQSKTIPFRKTAMQAAAQAASAAGVLPEPLAACQEMDRDGAKLRKLLGEREAVRSGVRQSAEEVALDKLAKRCLDLLKLGELPVLQALPTLTPLSKLPELNMPILTGLALAGIRKSVPEFDALGPEFAKEWAKLETGGPNVAQVLSLLTTCMLSQCMSRADHATPSWRGRPSLLERGKHADSLAQEAVADFGSAATHAGDFASACGLPQDAPLVLMAGLATQARQQLQSLPPWQLHELSTAHFEAIEESFGREQWSALPEAFKEAWNQLKQEKTGASEVAALIHGGLSWHAWEEGAYASPQAAALKNALTRAKDSIDASVEEAAIRRLDDIVSDMITLYGDIRSPRDLSAMMESLVRRMDLSGQVKVTDRRSSGLDVGKVLTPFSLPVPIVRVMAEAFKQMGRSLHITSDGNSMQMFIGQADGARAKAGVAASAKNTIPLPLSTAFDALGLTVSAEAGIGTGGTKASGEGVTLRMLAEDTDAESMRRRFGSVMSDLAQSSFCVGEGKDYGDVLGMLFDRHDSLSVSNSSTRSKSGSGRTYVAATASLKAVLPEISMPTMPNPLKPVPNPLERKTALSGKLASHNLRDKSQAFDTTGAVKVRNFSITAKHNVDATAGFGVGFGRGVYGRGGVHSLSVVSEGDTVVAHHTRTSTRYNNRKEFKAEVEADRQRWLEILAQKSSTPGLSKAEKLEVAERQLDMHLSDAKDFDHVWIRTRRVKEGEFQVVRALNERAARVWNDLESAARVVQSKGDGEAANEIRTLIGELINDERSWEPADLLSGTQGSASSVLISSLLPVRESSGAATAARSASSLLRNPGPA